MTGWLSIQCQANFPLPRGGPAPSSDVPWRLSSGFSSSTCYLTTYASCNKSGALFASVAHWIFSHARFRPSMEFFHAHAAGSLQQSENFLVAELFVTDLSCYFFFFSFVPILLKSRKEALEVRRTPCPFRRRTKARTAWCCVAVLPSPRSLLIHYRLLLLTNLAVIIKKLLC